jgi:hypothetical protein
MAEEVNASAGLIYARSRMSTPRSSLSRSAGVGLTAGLVLGAIYLGVRAVMLWSPSCEGLRAEECGLELELAKGLVRMHVLAAIGLALVATGLFVSLRKKP